MIGEVSILDLNQENSEGGDGEGIPCTVWRMNLEGYEQLSRQARKSNLF